MAGIVDRDSRYNIGITTGLTLRKEVLDRLNIQPGDTLYLTEAPAAIVVRRTIPK